MTGYLYYVAMSEMQRQMEHALVGSGPGPAMADDQPHRISRTSLFAGFAPTGLERWRAGSRVKRRVRHRQSLATDRWPLSWPLIGVAVVEASARGRRPSRSSMGETAYEGTEGGDSQMSAEAVSPITTYFRVCDGVRVRFADNRADSDITVLLLAPWPESLWAFRRIWHRVAAVGRVVAIDLPGFGHSDGRPELIAPDASGAFLARLIDEWGLGAPHIVGPDVGTAAALFLAARAPERVTSLTVGGGAVRFPIEAGGALKDIIEAPSLDVVRGLDARTNIGYAVEPGAASDSEPDVHEDYVSAYDLGRFAESARFVRHYPEQNPVLRDLLPTITTPTQIVAGRDDDLVPWSNNQYLDDLLPNSEIHPLDAGHFAWEQAAAEYGRLVVDWVSGGYRRVAAG